jgi:hypothetical protein
MCFSRAAMSFSSRDSSGVSLPMFVRWRTRPSISQAWRAGSGGLLCAKITGRKARSLGSM